MKALVYHHALLWGAFNVRPVNMVRYHFKEPMLLNGSER